MEIRKYVELNDTEKQGLQKVTALKLSLHEKRNINWVAQLKSTKLDIKITCMYLSAYM